MNFKTDTQTVPQSSSDNGRYNNIHHKSDENSNPKRTYDSVNHSTCPSSACGFAISNSSYIQKGESLGGLMPKKGFEMHEWGLGHFPYPTDLKLSFHFL